MALPGSCTLRDGIVVLVVEFFKCCLGGRRVGVGHVESALLVCLVDVDRVLTPVGPAVIASSLLFFVVRFTS